MINIGESDWDWNTEKTSCADGNAFKRKLQHSLCRQRRMMEAVRTSETSVDNRFTRQYIREDNSEHHTRRRENLKSHMSDKIPIQNYLQTRDALSPLLLKFPLEYPIRRVQKNK
jgi:hypothetical protein